MIYEFECVSCKHTQEEIRSVKDRDIALECMKCGAVMKRKITGTANVVYKDDGFPTADAKKVRSWVDKNTPYPETK